MDDDHEDQIEEDIEREFQIAQSETAIMFRQWANRNANPLVVTPVVVSAILSSLRLGFDKELYDNTVRTILSQIEESAQKEKGEDNGSRRDLH